MRRENKGPAKQEEKTVLSWEPGEESNNRQMTITVQGWTLRRKSSMQESV